MNLKYKGTVSKGKFKPDNVPVFKKAFCSFEGKEVEVIIKKVTKKRTINQNRYLWAIYTMLADHIGTTSDDMHVTLKKMFLPIPTGKFGWTKPGSSKELSTAEMTTYIDNIKRWAGQFLNYHILDMGEIDL